MILLDRSTRTVCDPFCGSGTTLVESALEGRRFIGFDIDPLAVAIARAKTQPLTTHDLSTVEKHWLHFIYDNEKPEHVPKIPRLHHWFSPQAIAQLSSIKAGCLALPEAPRLFCLVVFSSIIRRVSNADDQTQKTYVSHTLHKTPPLPSDLFSVFLKRALAGMRQYMALLSEPPEGQIILADSRSLPDTHLGDVITSPPYIDSIDYVYNQMLEYFWLLPELRINNYNEYRELRKKPMGFNRHAPRGAGNFRDRLLNATRTTLEEALGHIQKRSPKEARTVRIFFDDFLAHCEQVSERQESGDFYICIVGNSVIRQATVPTVDILHDLFYSLGYHLQDHLTYEIRRHYMKFPRRSNSGKIKQDHVLIFRR
jgi:hypothetical protein